MASALMLRTTILFTGGLVFHASAVNDNGHGIVFVGHAGAGKSTQRGLWSNRPGVIAMNDDRIAVRVEARGPTCYGTPWGGTADMARNHAAPLAAGIMVPRPRCRSFLSMTHPRAVSNPHRQDRPPRSHNNRSAHLKTCVKLGEAGGKLDICLPFR
jgi:hypothetical protein